MNEHILMGSAKTETAKEIDYRAAFVFKSLMCDSCKTGRVAKDMMICKDEQELIARAMNEHRIKGDKMHVLCAKPILCIVYDHVLVDTRLLPDWIDNT